MNSSNQSGVDLLGPSLSRDLDCGSLSEEDLATMQAWQYWCEGVLFATIGAVGLLGNLVSILILTTK